MAIQAQRWESEGTIELASDSSSIETYSCKSCNYRNRCAIKPALAGGN